MIYMNQKKLFFATIIICILLASYACHKSFQSLSIENNSIIENSQTYYSSLVSSEESLLAMPYDQLKKSSNLRRFARLGKISSLLQWDNVQSFYRNGTSYAIVPVEKYSSHQDNPNFESIRCMLFLQKDGDKIEMNIIEVYRKKNEINSTSLLNSVKTLSENKIFNENTSIEGLNASVIFYDEYYYNKSSFIVKNGIWQAAKIVIENTPNSLLPSSVKSMSVGAKTVSDVSKSLSTISPMSGCSVCKTYALVGIWYDIQTGVIVDSEVLDSWEECIDPSYPPNGNIPGTSQLMNYPPTNTKKINNNVTNPCISNTLNSIENAIKNLSITALNNENIYMPMNFNFVDVNTLPLNVGGQCLEMYTDSDGVLNFNILLNKTLLPNMALEYTAKIILHEVVHAVLLSKGFDYNGLIQHNEIANYYRSIISSALQGIYPGLSNFDAEALAWGGLTETNAYLELPSLKREAINNILSNYGDLSAGTACN
jgi:hypothetical protein